MSVSVVSSSLSAALQGAAGSAAQGGGPLQAALQQGDIPAAQTAFSSIQSAMQGSSGSSQGGQAAQPSSDNGQMTQAMDDLQTALLTGNISGAQSAFTELQAAFQEMTGSGTSVSQAAGGSFSALA